MNRLSQELQEMKKRYDEEIIQLINDVYPENIKEAPTIKGYSRIAALNSAKKIVNEVSDANIFLDEALNDKLSSYLLISLGSSRSALTSLRAFVESSLYFFYYKDHPIEFQKWKEHKFRMRIKELFVYLIEHPAISSFQLENYVQNLEKEYGTLSLAVHGASDKFMMTGQNNFPHIFQKNTVEISKWNTRSTKAFTNVVALLLGLNKEKFLSASHRHEKDIIKLALGNTISSDLSTKIGISL